MSRRRSLIMGVVGSMISNAMPNNEIWYTSSDGEIVTPYRSNVFGATIVSNTYEDGKGVITFDGAVTTIGDYAFGECSKLTSITIPDSVTTIGNVAFSNCGSLTSVYCKPTTPPTMGAAVFAYNANSRKIYVPATSVDAYKTASNWSTYASAIVGYDFENDRVYYPDSTVFEFPLYINVTDVDEENDYYIEYIKSNSIISELYQWCNNQRGGDMDFSIYNPNIYINGNKIIEMRYEMPEWSFTWENMEDNWYGGLNESGTMYIGMTK